MEAIGLGVGVVALFAQCVSYFELFQTADAFESKFKILLSKVDIQQERLLVWGELVGLSDSGTGNLKFIEGQESRVSRILESVRRILEDTDALRTKYGVNEAPLAEEQRNQISLTSGALKRFRLRFTKLQHEPGVFKKTRWAISDASKFGELVKDLKDLIDGLTDVVPADPQNQRIEDDIANLIDNIDTLEVLSEACKDEYPIFHKAADSAISASEQGTQADRLSLRADTFPAGERRDKVTQKTDSKSSSKTKKVNASVKTTSKKPTSLDQESQSAAASQSRIAKHPKLFFVLTDRCLRNQSATPCDHTSLGEQLAPRTEFDFVSFSASTLSWQPGSLIRSKSDYRSHISFTSAQLEGYHLQVRKLQMSLAILADEIETPRTELAFLKIYIYCAPCACQISSALSMRFRRPEDWWVSVEKIIRVDHRLSASCCAADSERLNACESLLQYMTANIHEEKLRDIDWNFLDISIYEYWDDDMEPDQLSEYMERILDDHKADESVVGIIFIGERNATLPLLKSGPFPQNEPRMPPSSSPIFMLSLELDGRLQDPDASSLWRRRYIGSYVPTKPKLVAK